MKNSMKTPDQKKRSKQLGKEIRDNLERYEYLRAHGGSDPFWSDGVNMNLCRNHAIYLRSRVETDLDPEYYVKYLRESRKKLEVILGSEYLEPKIREGQLTIWDFIGGQ